MNTITRFSINQAQKQLEVTLASGDEFKLAMEFLRVIDANVLISGQGQPSTKLVTHKKDVELTTLESVGKHGFRLLFDDKFSTVLNHEQILELNQHQQSLWQQYLDAIKESGFTRETAIDIKAL